MPSLSKELRRFLEKSIAGENGARQIAELGAEQSLRRLAVDRHEPHTSLTPEERMLRAELRAHGRQLGDKRDLQRGSQSINHLTQAVAYEHWHRLLFARFLAENDLLMHPEHGVALSLEEVKEVALGIGRDWIDVASEYAQRMLLREVFRSDDPALRVPLSPERRLELEKKLNSLPKEIFLADDSLGWVYQFWQKDAKDQVNRSEVKIGADELSPVTQLFTEDYMVLFLLENTLGAWWTARHGRSDLAGYEWTFLRLNSDGSPAAGAFTGWPQTSSQVKVLDPCMGSGHFITFALPILAYMRAEEETISLQAAIYAVLSENIFGLELDLRCSQIAAFNLALTAWKLNGSHFELPSLNLACSGLGINAREEDWVNLATTQSAAEAMRRLYKLFSDSPTLGSLIDPLRLNATIFASGSEEVLSILEEALRIEDLSQETRELAIAAQGVLSASQILSQRFTLVATNVPYLGRKKQDQILLRFCDQYYPDAKADLATCFLDRAISLCSQSGTAAVVLPQNTFFLGTYEKLRRRLLTRFSWNVIARLGEHGFRSQAAAGAFTALLAISNDQPLPGQHFAGIDVSATRNETAIFAEEKAALLCSKEPVLLSQSNQLENPNAVITFETATGNTLLARYANSYQGAGLADIVMFRRYFWEMPKCSDGWVLHQSSPTGDAPFTGMHFSVKWDDGLGTLANSPEARIQGKKAWGKRAILCAWLGKLPVGLYLGTLFDNSAAAIVPNDESDLAAIWCFLSSQAFPIEVRKINQKTQVANATLVKVPFDLAHWRGVAYERYPQGLPKPFSSDPTQWLFSGHPYKSDTPLHVAVGRLLGYKWPRQTGYSLMDAPALQPDGLDEYEDTDGIVCLAALAGEEAGAARLRDLLQAAFGSEYNLSSLLAGSASTNLHEWLRDDFFDGHCKIFHQRPFIWHIWDGIRDGFHALVNYHKLDRNNLEKLIYSYLGDWLTRQRQDVQNGVDGAEFRLAAAEHLQAQLKYILAGESEDEARAPYDIFVRWKPITRQPIGWEPDLDDGIRINIRPWITSAKLYRATKPGILRTLPEISYSKDRGKEPLRNLAEFPWFDGSTDRITDLHLSISQKRRARGLK